MSIDVLTFGCRLNTLESEVMRARAAEAGLDDAGILDLNQVVAYFAYANRIASGLGVDLTGDTLGLSPNENEEGFGHS